MALKLASDHRSKFRLTAIAGFFLAFSIIPVSANALGFGNLRVFSSIGQPLKAEVDLILKDAHEANEMALYVASAEEYINQGLGSRGDISGLTFDIQKSGNSYVALLSTRDALHEPYTYVVLEGSSGNGRTIRTYPVLLNFEAHPLKSHYNSNKNNTDASTGASEYLNNEKNASLKKYLGAKIDDDASKFYENIFEVGVRPDSKNLTKLNGGGKNQNFGVALSRITPKGWKGYVSQVDVSSMAPITWRSENKFWISVLDDVLSKNFLTATVDWGSHEITFRDLNYSIKDNVGINSELKNSSSVNKNKRKLSSE